MIFTLNFHEFLHTMYKYALNSVVKISMMFAKYFEYYTIILGGAVFSWTRCITLLQTLHLATSYFSHFSSQMLSIPADKHVKCPVPLVLKWERHETTFWSQHLFPLPSTSQWIYTQNVSIIHIIMAALCNRAGHYIFALWFLSSSSSFFYLFASPNLSGRILDVYHTSIHGVALVRI